MDELNTLKKKRQRLRLRCLALQATRRFFIEQGFLEVTTPVLHPFLIPEEHIHAVEAEEGFLLPSPEIHMKCLLAAGYERIFQIGPAFRKGEKGQHHLQEFTLLEWYRAGAGYQALADDCEQLLPGICEKLYGERAVSCQGRTVDLTPPWPRITAESAFESHAGWNPLEERDPERFERDLMERVVPLLDPFRPVFLTDFPDYEASLAVRKEEDPRVAERLELFAGGLELANGFSELTDAREQRDRFLEVNRKRKERGEQPYRMPEGFLEALQHMPASAGMAMGVDRLVMFLSDAEHIQDVVAHVPGKP